MDTSDRSLNQVSQRFGYYFGICRKYGIGNWGARAVWLPVWTKLQMFAVRRDEGEAYVHRKTIKHYQACLWLHLQRRP